MQEGNGCLVEGKGKRSTPENNISVFLLEVMRRERETKFQMLGNQSR